MSKPRHDLDTFPHQRLCDCCGKSLNYLSLHEIEKVSKAAQKSMKDNKYWASNSEIKIIEHANARISIQDRDD